MKNFILITAITSLVLTGCGKNAEVSSLKQEVSSVASLQECGYVKSEKEGVTKCQIQGLKATGTVRRKGLDFLFTSDAVVTSSANSVRMEYFAPADQRVIQEVNLKTGKVLETITQRGNTFTDNWSAQVKYGEKDGQAALLLAYLEDDGTPVGENHYVVKFKKETVANLTDIPVKETTAPQVKISTSTSENSDVWVYIGKTSEGKELRLNTASIQSKPHAEFSRWFVYSIDGQNHNAYTNDCAGGDGRMSWYLTNDERQIWVTSQAGVDLIERVCK